MKNIFLIIFILILSGLSFGQANNFLRAKCPNSSAYFSLLLAANGNIYNNPCSGKDIYINDILTPRYLNSIAVFDATARFNTSIVNLPTATSSTYRLGNAYNYFEQIQRSTGALNEARLKTIETENPAAFAELFLLSDNAHAYAYLRAQRNIQLRSDDLFVTNFLDDNKFRLSMFMDNVQSNPLEDTSAFRVGNYTDQTNYIFLNNNPSNMFLQMKAVDGIFLMSKTHITVSQTPASATEICTTGQITWDANFVYVCTTTNAWKRTALTTW